MNTINLFLFMIFAQSWNHIYDRFNTVMIRKIIKRDYANEVDYIVLIYSLKLYAEINIYNKITTHIMKENVKRKEMSSRPDIFYEVIIDQNGPNNVSNDPMFDTFKKIGKLINSKEDLKRNVRNSAIKKRVDLTKIYGEFLKCHLNEIKIHRNKIYKLIVQLSNLIADLDENSYEIRYRNIYKKKQEALSFFKINENELDINNDIIKSERIHDDPDNKKVIDAYEKEFKKRVLDILKDINEPIFYHATRKIINCAYNKDVENLYDEEISTKFEREIREKGMQEIDYIFKDNNIIKELEIFVNTFDRNTITEYKNKLKLDFCRELKINIFENVKICRLYKLQKVLQKVFENESENYTTM
ncbi:uncharacterized protein VNE69_05139 [Vairimorpha necatrix]|uniref:Uncharacterized protein n=1 Tax=Vairimorpha necatrix TaxID=6039 RepID=A0AAX4JC85_9MICR